MGKHSDSLHENLAEIHRRPAPFEVYTAELLWNDEHISKNMLAFHLDEESAPASRPREFIQRSADWIRERFALTHPATTSQDPKTLEQVGAIIGVTKERVRQIQNKALGKIREVLEEEYLAA